MAVRGTLLKIGVRWPPEMFLRRKLQGLARAGFRVVIASPLLHGAIADPIDGLELVRLPHWEEGTFRRALGIVRDAGRMLTTHRRRLGPAVVASWRNRNRDGAYRIRRSLLTARGIFAVGRLDADVVHFEWESAAVQYVAAASLLRRPVTMSCRGGDIDIVAAEMNAVFEHRLRDAFDRATLVHCVSEATMRTAVQHGLAPDKARLVRPAVDTERFHPSTRIHPSKPQEQTFGLVSIGWLRWRKGWEYTLEAVALLVDVGIPVRFDVIGGEPGPDHGEPSELPRIRHIIEDRGLEGIVRLHGEQDECSVRAMLREADVLLHASVAEGIPNVVLEAMASGVPVVVTNVGGTAEAVRDGIDGYVVPGAMLVRWPTPAPGCGATSPCEPGWAKRAGAASDPSSRSTHKSKRSSISSSRRLVVLGDEHPPAAHRVDRGSWRCEVADDGGVRGVAPKRMGRAPRASGALPDGVDGASGVRA